MNSQKQPSEWIKQCVDQFEEVIACIALIVIVTSVTWGVFTRYVTEQPATWASEIATLSFAWLVFFGSAACMKYKLHPSIDMLVKKFSPNLQSVIRWINHILVLGFCIFMAVYGGQFAWASWENPTPVLRWPLTFLYGPVAFCFALMGIRYMQVLIKGPWEIESERETYVG